MSGARDHSLIGLMDTAVTAMGGRWLRRWVQRPIRDRHHLGLRHHAVGALLARRHYEGIRECLRPIGDLERALARIALRTARPHDLAQLRTSLGALPELYAGFEGVDSPRLHHLGDAIGCFPLLYARLAAGLVEHPPPLLREGGVIASASMPIWTPSGVCPRMPGRCSPISRPVSGSAPGWRVSRSGTTASLVDHALARQGMFAGAENALLPGGQRR